MEMVFILKKITHLKKLALYKKYNNANYIRDG